jgi:hypothetical protein
VTGPTPAHISIGFVYDAVYYSAANFDQSFGQAGTEITAIRARQEIISWKRIDIDIDIGVRSITKGLIAEGWTLSAHHSIDLGNIGTLHKGDGTLLKNNVTIIDTIAGRGPGGFGGGGFSGDGGPATEAEIYFTSGVVVDAEGNVYFGDAGNNRVRKVDTNGIITTVAGNGWSGYCCDGGPATQAQLGPRDLAVDAAGNLYISDYENRRVRKVDKNGIITTVAGKGIGFVTDGDGLPATQVYIHYPDGVAVDSEGNLYFAEPYRHIIRKVDTRGIIIRSGQQNIWI